MDISLSILTGLGLRLFLFAKVPPGPLSNKLTAAILGLWEGAIVHQLSARASSNSTSLDHILAFGLRLAVDLLLSRDAQRMMMILLWSSLSTVAAELVAPHESLRPKKSTSTSVKERRHRHSRSVPHIPNDVPIIQAPLPPRVRAYRPPSDLTPALPAEPPQLSSTPVFSQDPPTPPSFFLHETVASTSPSPKHVLMRTPVEELFSPEQQMEALPVRPASGLATTLEAKADLSPSPLPVAALLPTPPTTIEGAPPSVSDAQRDNIPARFELYTIIEQSSPEDGLTPNDTGNASRPTHEADVPQEGDDTDTTPLPVPAPMEALPHNLHVRRRSSGNDHVDNWLAAQDTQATSMNDANVLFTTPFSPGLSPAAPIPVLLRSRHQGFGLGHEPEEITINASGSTTMAKAEMAVGEYDQDIDQRSITPTNHDFYQSTRDNDGIEFPGTSVLVSLPVGPAQAPQPQYHSPDELGFESDELRTPIYRRSARQPVETDNDEDDSDPLRTPKHLRHPIAHDSGYDTRQLEEIDQLSPLGLDVRSALAADTDDTFNFVPVPVPGPSRRNAPSPSTSIPVVAGAVYMPTSAVPVGALANFLCDDEVLTGNDREVSMPMPGSLDQNTLLLPPTPRRPAVPPLSSVDDITSSDNNAQPPTDSDIPVLAASSKSKGKGKGKAKAKAKPTSIFSSAPVAPPPAPPPVVIAPVLPPPRARSPPPPSPSTILSEGSELSVFSTKAPTRLWTRADALRREARDCESRRAVIEEQRRRAELSGRALEAIQLRTDLRDIDRRVERLHEKAARRYYVARNLLPSPTKIDVHGLRPREAFERIDRAIIQANKDGKRSVTVIVGKGLHSVNQQPTLKPAVFREMQRLKLAVIVNPRNEGQLIITLPPAPAPGGRA
ncbi:hypothetical protein D9619_001345 [Psilocybe cf. subviscida]|uniref:Smr domain-containing protein n=1 Tax=Psilocybe cf. subviscida TaxID=2480587 RepID=A0A8H5F3R6_9AGAR|nr:hypothetical protein D9619_001345 [Psilocybe cf. subviscida]